jgi:glycosyltransferase involved in cell wall biosynthesis
MPLVSVLLAVHNDSRFLGQALASVLRQTVDDLELIVVDDASTDETPALLAAVGDPRLRVITNDEQEGLASSLNHGLSEASGRYVARLDADDVALPERLARQLERMRRDGEEDLAVIGSAVLDLDAGGRPGMLHRNPAGATGIRWLTLFGSPFFHPTVLVDRDRVDRAQLRYDPSYAESEDYELWARLLSGRQGANLPQPLVLKRVHPGQASLRRAGLQESLQRELALREIGRIAPALSAEQAGLAWGLGSGRKIERHAAAAYRALLRAFEDHYGVDAEVRASATRMLIAAGATGKALELGVSQPARLALRGARRRVQTRRARDRASSWLTALDGSPAAVRVTVVSPEPTPYRSPLFDRVASRPEVDLTVIYAAETVANRTWSVELEHRAEFLRGRRLPGVHGVLRHDYPVTPGIGRALARSNPDAVVISGWSTFASQAAIAWSRAHGIPYVLLVESHDLGPRAWWRRAVKGFVVPRIVRKAANVLVVGTAARESVVERGADQAAVRIFANTVDVDAWSDRALRLQKNREERRAAAGLVPEDVVVFSVARLVPEKGLSTLIRAAAATGDRRIRVVVAGSGPGSQPLTELAESLGVTLTLLGDLHEAALAEAYVRADIFALLSLHETWGVVVNEAAASGLPLLLSDRVGAARDLVRGGTNGFVVPAEDVDAAATALERLASDAELRKLAGEHSREVAGSWGYDSSVESFVTAVRAATSR